MRNLRETVEAAVAAGKEVLIDCEHFFDGYKSNAAYALKFVETAITAGARWVVLCDTNGGTMPVEVGEIVTAVLLGAARVGGAAYVKHARVAGDYATASAAVCIDAAGPVRAVIGSCGPTPVRDDNADALLGDDRSDSAIERAAALLDARADPLDDVRGSAEYRRLLIPRLLLRAIRRAESGSDA